MCYLDELISFSYVNYSLTFTSCKNVPTYDTIVSQLFTYFHFLFILYIVIYDYDVVKSE